MNARTAAQIHTSEAWTLKSENTGQEYRISVSLPASYDHEPEKTYPTVYMVDGNVFYEMVTGAARLMAMSGLIPEVIIVSVGYPVAA
jgi:predicted alpha/beta superfamily hydrolase